MVDTSEVVKSAHNAHTSNQTELIGKTKLFQSLRERMGQFLRIFDSLGFINKIDNRNILLIGPGEGYELASILSSAHWEINYSNSRVITDSKWLYNTFAIEFNENRAKELPRFIPDISVDINSLETALFPNNIGLIELAFVWNDLKKEARRVLLQKSMNSLIPGGYLVIGDAFLSSPNSLLNEHSTSDETLWNIRNEVNKMYDRAISDIKTYSQNNSDCPPVENAISSLNSARNDALQGKDARESFDSPDSFRQFVNQELGESVDVRWIPVPEYGRDGIFSGFFILRKK